MMGFSRVMAILAAMLGLAMAAPATPADAPSVRIESGLVVGAVAGPALRFSAIPYAAPPVGALRWVPPQPPRAWSGERAADAPGPACPQPILPGGRPNVGGYNGPTSEDCLTLDVWAPPGAKHAPVMVWIYGGGNIAGVSSFFSYDGRNFARDGVILVAMNYRLGALGFFAHPALTAEAAHGQPLVDYGLMDQIAALKWVRRNIAAFGGDPANVTLFGESAGGADVLDLLSIPAARGLFQRAIVQSGGGWSAPATLAERERDGAGLATALGLSGAAATTAQLRALPADALIASQAGKVGVAIDGRLMRESARDAFARGDEDPVPLMIGSDSNEASLMGEMRGWTPSQPGSPLWAAYAADGPDAKEIGRQMFNDAVMGAPARWFARKASQMAPAWLYYFSYVPERQRATRPGTNHASEIPFVFDSLDAVPGRSALATPSERAEAALAHSCWVGFAKFGRPGCVAGGETWPAYTPATDQLLEFGDPPAVRVHFRKAQLDAQEAASHEGALRDRGPGL
jgi:para-nitrobenzyl esterase